MDQSAAVRKPYHGFEDEVYTLMVGLSSQRLNVQADILMQIPYFADLIRDGKLKQDTPYTMPKQTPIAVSTIFAFIRDGKIPKSSIVADFEADLNMNQIAHYVFSYKYALQLGLEETQNAIVDAVMPLLPQCHVCDFCPAFQSSTTSEFSNSQMYAILSRAVAWKFQEIQGGESFRYIYCALTKVIGKWQKESLLAIIAHLTEYIEEDPTSAARDKPCQYHVHNKTAPCSAFQIKDEQNATIMQEGGSTASAEDIETNDQDKLVEESSIDDDIEGIVKERAITKEDVSTIEDSATTSQVTGQTQQEQEADDDTQDTSPDNLASVTHVALDIKPNDLLVSEMKDMHINQQEEDFLGAEVIPTLDDHSRLEQALPDSDTDSSYDMISVAGETTEETTAQVDSEEEVEEA